MAKIVTQLVDPRSKINDPLGLFGGEKTAAPAAAAAAAPAATTSAAESEADRLKREDELRRRRGSMATTLTSGMDIGATIERPALRPTLG